MKESHSPQTVLRRECTIFITFLSFCRSMKGSTIIVPSPLLCASIFCSLFFEIVRLSTNRFGEGVHHFHLFFVRLVRHLKVASSFYRFIILRIPFPLCAMKKSDSPQTVVKRECTIFITF